jgi:hypothetical protein
VSAPPRTEPEREVRERGVEDRLEHLRERLLDQPIQHRWDTKQPHPAIGLGDLDLPDRLRPVCPCIERVTDLAPVLVEPSPELLRGDPIDTGRAAVALHAP